MYNRVAQKIKEKGHCVIVVAEGAEEGLIDPFEKITKVEKRDGSGNLIYDDIGKFLEREIPKQLLENH